jgi:hypothetical protein
LTELVEVVAHGQRCRLDKRARDEDRYLRFTVGRYRLKT